MITSSDIIIFSITAIIIAIISTIIFAKIIPISLYIKCKSLDPHLSIKYIIFLKLRNIEPQKILVPYSIALQEKINVTLDDLTTHYLAGGNLIQIVSAMSEAKKNNIEDFNFKIACAIELAGKEPVKCIKKCINTQSFSTDTMQCITNDGTPINISISLKIKGNIRKMIGSYNEEYLLNKVLDSIFNKIYAINTINELESAKTKTAKSILEEQISKDVLEEKLDTNCEYDIKNLEIKIA